MTYELLAKPNISLLVHTLAVKQGVTTILNATADDQLKFLGLNPELKQRFIRLTEITALLHDLGKAGSHFQRFIREPNFRKNPQGIRHEFVSALIAEDPRFKKWISPLFQENPNDWFIVIFAILGHHRKHFPVKCKPSPNQNLHVDLGLPDFQDILNLFDIPNPPNHQLNFHTGNFTDKNIISEFSELNAVYHQVILNKTEKSLLSLIKTTLISSDVLGSIAETQNSSLFGRIEKSLVSKPNFSQYNRLVNNQEKKIKNKIPNYQPHKFQIETGNAKGPVTFVPSGCGSGKTLAAFYWSKKHAVNRRLYVCYPTTGTSTQGFRSYLKNEEKSDLAHMYAVKDKELIGVKSPEWFFTDDDWDNDPNSKTNDDDKEIARISREQDASYALGLLNSQIVSCTVDTIIGILGNQRRGIYAFPAIAQGSFVFDEIHSYDPTLWKGLLLFIERFNAPTLLMSGSLPTERLQQLQQVTRKKNFELEIIQGHLDHETAPRYQRIHDGDPWELAQETLNRGEKVLWIVNTVDRAISLYESGGKELGAVCLHSHFRRTDRLNNHDKINKLFENHGPAFAITTQVAEMSLDLSADLLITESATIDALIQRLGRLNRFLDKNIGRFLILNPENPKPYKKEDLENSQQWLDSLPNTPLNQRMLLDAWQQFPHKEGMAIEDFPWLYNTYSNHVQPIRNDDSPTVQIVIEGQEDFDSSFPMTFPFQFDWQNWNEINHMKIAPTNKITYNNERGGKWLILSN